MKTRHIGIVSGFSNYTFDNSFKKKEYIIEKGLWIVPRPESRVFREIRLLSPVRQSEILHRSLRLASGQKQRRGGEWCLSEGREAGWPGSSHPVSSWRVGLRGTAEENLPLEYRWCLRNGWFIRNRPSVTNLFSAVLSLSFFFLPCPLALGAGLLLTPHPDTPTSCSACSPSLRPSSSLRAGSPRNNWVSMATWRQLKNGN